MSPATPSILKGTMMQGKAVDSDGKQAISWLHLGADGLFQVLQRSRRLSDTARHPSTSDPVISPDHGVTAGSDLAGSRHSARMAME